MNLLFSFFTLILASNTWETSYYDSHTPASFFALSEVNAPIEPGQFNRELLNAAVFFATNEFRARKRLPLFKYSPVLEKSAELHSGNMLEHNFFDHIDRKNRALRTPLKRILSCGGKDFVSVSENLVLMNIQVLGPGNSYFRKEGKLVDDKGKLLRTYTYAQLARKMVDDWAHSKGHRKNLQGNFSYLGCGASAVKTEKDGLKVVYATQNFGSKK